MASPDLSAITSSFVEFGGQIISKQVNAWNVRQQGIKVMLGVNKPQVLPKLSATGTPRPYRSQDDTSGNGVAFDDRTLIAYQSKWDHDFDPEQFRNTYLSNNDERPYYVPALEQVAKEYLAYLNNSTLYLGVRNGSGTTPADVCDGWGTIIAAEIVNNALTPISTDDLTDTNAVDVIEGFVEEAASGTNQFMLERDSIVYLSWGNWFKFMRSYRTLNSYQIKLDETMAYRLDNRNVTLRPASWMGSSNRLIYTLSDNLVFGTDVNSVATYASQRRNIVEVRHMMPAGCQIADLGVLFVNDKA